MSLAPATEPRPGHCLVVIGASTGGTRVLTELVPNLPAGRATILIVQHMPKYINASLVRSLGKGTSSPVRLAEDGESVQEGTIYVAPSEVHCTLVHNRTFSLRSGPEVNYVRPSIDVTMHSLQTPRPSQSLIGVILTGMGKDGAAGLAHMKRLGALTFAQDQTSSCVYGMPAEAVKTGCVDRVLPPREIARAITRALCG